MIDYITTNWWQLLLMLPLIIFVFAGFVFYLIEIITHHPVLLIPIVIVILAMIGSLNIAKAETFQYKNKLVIEAPDYKTAAKLCFNKLNPVFVSEEKALNVIDICANPIKGEVK